MSALSTGDVDSNLFSVSLFLLNSDLPPGVSVIFQVQHLQVNPAGRVLVGSGLNNHCGRIKLAHCRASARSAPL